MQGHPEEVYACEFLPENRLLSASADKLYLWDLETGTQLQESQQSPHTSPANSKHSCSDEQLLQSNQDCMLHMLWTFLAAK